MSVEDEIKTIRTQLGTIKNKMEQASGMTTTIRFWTAASSGGTVNLRNTVTVQDGKIISWKQEVS